MKEIKKKQRGKSQIDFSKECCFHSTGEDAAEEIALYTVTGVNKQRVGFQVVTVQPIQRETQTEHLCVAAKG